MNLYGIPDNENSGETKKIAARGQRQKKDEEGNTDDFQGSETTQCDMP